MCVCLIYIQKKMVFTKENRVPNTWKLKNRSIHSRFVSIKIDSVGMKKKKYRANGKKKSHRKISPTQLWTTLCLLKSTAWLLSYLFVYFSYAVVVFRAFPFLNFKFRRQFQCLIEILKGTMKQHYSLWKMDSAMHLFCRSMQCMRFIKLSFWGRVFFFSSQANKNYIFSL